MSSVSLIVIIAIITGVFSQLKKSAKKADENVREKRNSGISGMINKIPFEKLEYYIGEDAANEFKSYVGYKENHNIENDKELKNSYVEPSPKKTAKKKKKKPSKKVDNIYTSEKIVQAKPNEIFIEKKPEKRKKNPFEFTKNPITNAVIASEILGKPKCKK